MRKYVDVDILASLAAVVEVNTKHYQSDFDYDREAITKWAQNPEVSGDILLWMSREAGTWCVFERDTFISDTDAHMIWLNHKNYSNIVAFAVELSGMKDGKPVGTLYELDYKAHTQRVEKAALPAKTVSLTFESGGKVEMPYEKVKGNWESIQHEHGKIISSRFNAADGELQDVLQQEADARRRMNARSFDVYVKKLAAPEKPSAIGRLEAAKQAVKPPAPADRQAKREAAL